MVLATMSGYLTGKALYVSLPAHLKITLICLTDASDDKGFGYPSKRRLARQIGVDVRSVRRNITELVKRGYLTREKRFDENGRQRSNGYQLNVEKLPNPAQLFGGDTYVQGEGDICVQGDTQDVPGEGDTQDVPPLTSLRTSTLKPINKKARPENIDQVIEYFREIEASDPVEMAHEWNDHFSANGFLVGKAKAPMKDWKAACRNWKRTSKRFEPAFQVTRRNGTQKPKSKLARALASFERADQGR